MGRHRCQRIGPSSRAPLRPGTRIKAPRYGVTPYPLSPRSLRPPRTKTTFSEGRAHDECPRALCAPPRIGRVFVFFDPSCPSWLRRMCDVSSVRVFVPRLALLRRAPQLVVLAVRTPRIGVEPGGSGVGLDFPMGAERGVAVFGGLLPPARAEPHECCGLGIIRGDGCWCR